jgi:hypothetical protein
LQSRMPKSAQRAATICAARPVLIASRLATGGTFTRSPGLLSRTSSTTSTRVVLPTGEVVEHAAMPTLTVKTPAAAAAFVFLPCDVAGSGTGSIKPPAEPEESLDCSGLSSDLLTSPTAGAWHVTGDASGLTGLSTRAVILSAP